jgi:hypothetical protein
MVDVEEGSTTSHRASWGYLDARFRRSLAAWGEPRPLAASGSWVLARVIPGTEHRDGLLGYPRLLSTDWHALDADLRAQTDLVSVVGVTDALLDVDPTRAARTFPDLCVRYKDHAVLDPRRPEPSAHHRRRVRRARAELRVDVAPEPLRLLDEWERLYAHLRRRHGLQGIKALSRDAFADQLAVDGCVALTARQGDRIVSMTIWYLHGTDAYYHLGASDDAGYAASASYALFDEAIALLASRGVTRLDLGANAGAGASDQGLTRFKLGWASDVRPTYLAGRILRPDLYRTLLKARGGAPGTSFFPAYRVDHA